MTQNDTLRTALRANSAFSLASGLVLAAFAGPLEGFSGIDQLILRIVGFGLIPWGFLVARAAARNPVRRSDAIGVIAGDLSWVIGTVAVVILGASEFTGAGLSVFLVLGVAVAGFAAAQVHGLRTAL